MTCLVAFHSQRLGPNIIAPTLAGIWHKKFIENFKQISRVLQHFLPFEGIWSKDTKIESFFLSKDINAFCKPLLAIALHHRPMIPAGKSLFLERPVDFSGPKNSLSNCKSTCFEKLIFKHVFTVRKTKRIGKFDGLEPRSCEDMKRKVSGLLRNRGPFQESPETFRAT